MFKSNAREISELMEKIHSIDVERKITELDLEKKIIVLERNLDKVMSGLSNIENIKDLNELIENTKKIKERIRDLEDLKYLEKIDLLTTKEELEKFKKDIKILKKKQELIEKALDELPDLNKKKLELTEEIKKQIKRTAEEYFKRFESNKLDSSEFNKFVEEYSELKKKVYTIEEDLFEIIANIRKEIDLQRKSINALKSHDSEVNNGSELHTRVSHQLHNSKDFKKIKEEMELINATVSKNSEELRYLRQKILEHEDKLRLKIKAHEFYEAKESAKPKISESGSITTINNERLVELEKKLKVLSLSLKLVNKKIEQQQKLLGSTPEGDLRDTRIQNHDIEHIKSLIVSEMKDVVDLSKLEQDLEHKLDDKIVSKYQELENLLNNKLKERLSELSGQSKSNIEDIKHTMDSVIEHKIMLKYKELEELINQKLQEFSRSETHKTTATKDLEEKLEQEVLLKYDELNKKLETNLHNYSDRIDKKYHEILSHIASDLQKTKQEILSILDSEIQNMGRVNNAEEKYNELKQELINLRQELEQSRITKDEIDKEFKKRDVALKLLSRTLSNLKSQLDKYHLDISQKNNDSKLLKKQTKIAHDLLETKEKYNELLSKILFIENELNTFKKKSKIKKPQNNYMKSILNITEKMIKLEHEINSLKQIKSSSSKEIDLDSIKEHILKDINNKINNSQTKDLKKQVILALLPKLKQNLKEVKNELKLEILESLKSASYQQNKQGNLPSVDKDTLLKLNIIEAKLDEISKKHIKHNTNQEELEKEVYALENEINKIKEGLKNHDNEISLIRTEIKQLIKESHSKIHEHIHKTINQSESKVNEVIDGMQQELEIIKGFKDSILKEVDKKISSTDNQRFTEIIESMQQELEIIKNFREDILEEVDKKLTDFELKDREEIDKLKSFEGYLTQKLDEMYKEFSNKFVYMDNTLKHQIDALKLQLEEMGSYADVDSTKHTYLDSRLKKLESVIKSLTDRQEKINKILEENHLLRNEISSLRHSNTHPDKIDEIIEKMNYLIHENNIMKREILALKKEYDELYSIEQETPLIID